MTNYYTFHADGSPISDGAVDMRSAALDLLTYDCHEFEIRNEDGEYKLFVSRFSRNSMVGSKDLVEWSHCSGRSEDEVFENVLKHGGVNEYFAMSEAEYAEMLAELED